MRTSQDPGVRVAPVRKQAGWAQSMTTVRKSPCKLLPFGESRCVGTWRGPTLAAFSASSFNSILWQYLALRIQRICLSRLQNLFFMFCVKAHLCCLHLYNQSRENNEEDERHAPPSQFREGQILYPTKHTKGLFTHQKGGVWVLYASFGHLYY